MTTGSQTRGTDAHSQSFTGRALMGLARAARQELSDLHVQHVAFAQRADFATLNQAKHVVFEEELAAQGADWCVPRLVRLTPLVTTPMQLQVIKRGAISNLKLRRLRGSDGALSSFQARIHVFAVGLNFRDVLNVLGEYPGDPGPPGGDSSGVINSTDTNRIGNESVFGLGHAPALSSPAWWQRVCQQILGLASTSTCAEGHGSCCLRACGLT